MFQNKLSYQTNTLTGNPPFPRHRIRSGNVLARPEVAFIRDVGLRKAVHAGSTCPLVWKSAGRRRFAAAAAAERLSGASSQSRPVGTAWWHFQVSKGDLKTKFKLNWFGNLVAKKLVGFKCSVYNFIYIFYRNNHNFFTKSNESAFQWNISKCRWKEIDTQQIVVLKRAEFFFLRYVNDAN